MKESDKLVELFYPYCDDYLEFPLRDFIKESDEVQQKNAINCGIIALGHTIKCLQNVEENLKDAECDTIGFIGHDIRFYQYELEHLKNELMKNEGTVST